MRNGAVYLAFAAITCAPLIAKADLITGVLNITGVSNISLGTIGFEDNEFSINAPPAAQQGGFTTLAGTTGTVGNITDPPEPTGVLDVPDFITFAGAPNISITLTYLLPGIDGAAGCAASPAAAGQLCTPDLPDQSPFNLQNTSATTATASFEILGLEVDSSTGESVPIVGIFSTPNVDRSFQQVLTDVEHGGTITTTFSAQIVTTPEPGTSVELILGLMLLGSSRALFLRRAKI
jgi:hypothetical protein